MKEVSKLVIMACNFVEDAKEESRKAGKMVLVRVRMLAAATATVAPLSRFTFALAFVFRSYIKLAQLMTSF